MVPLGGMAAKAFTKSLQRSPLRRLAGTPIGFSSLTASSAGRFRRTERLSAGKSAPCLGKSASSALTRNHLCPECAPTGDPALGTAVAVPEFMDLHAAAATPALSRYPIDLRALIRAEYLEMPGLCLTLAQAARLWNVDRDTCLAMLESLTREGFLYRSRDSYFRADGCRS
jgi:hypothetical protein